MSAAPSSVPSSPRVAPSPREPYEIAEQPLGGGFVLVVCVGDDGVAAFLAHHARMLWDVTLVEC